MELKHAPTSILSSFSKINTNYQNMGGKRLQSILPRLLKVIQRHQSNYTPMRADLQNFPNEGKNVLQKTVVSVAVYGGLRCADLAYLEN